MSFLHIAVGSFGEPVNIAALKPPPREQSSPHLPAEDPAGFNRPIKGRIRQAYKGGQSGQKTITLGSHVQLQELHKKLKS